VSALALALSFAALALVDLQSFHQLAFLLFAGVLIDAFIASFAGSGSQARMS
jgi:hypothetical protein